MSFDWRSCYATFINLKHRKDRLILMEKELQRVNLHRLVTRSPGINVLERQWDKKKYGVMLQRSPGACGCYQSQYEAMQKALLQCDHAMIFEDDLVFCTDIIKRLDYIQDFLNKQDAWDVTFLGGTFHVNPPWWHKAGHSPDLQMCKCDLKRDAEQTEDPRMMRTYGCFSTHAYIVNVKSIEKILKYFDENVHLSMGIDWLFIKMQPQLKAFAFVPGCVKQYDNKSDIGKGFTIFSGFSKMNGTVENSKYWWQDKMEDFIPEKFDWKESKRKI